MRFSRTLQIVAVAIAIVVPIAFAIAIVTTGVDVPYWDEWEWADLIYRAHMGTLQFADVWAQHNEHRLLFPQLIVLALDKLGGWSQVREQLVSLVFLIVTELAVLGIIRRTIHGAAGAVATIMSCLFLFGLWQSENFSWGFQIAWFLCNACVVGVVALLARPNRQAIDIMGAIALGVIASYSSSQGLVSWAVGAVAIVLVPITVSRTLIVWLCAAAATEVVYRVGAVARTAGHMSLVHHPLDALRYVLAYFGSPLEGLSGPDRSALFGLLVVGVVLASFIADVVRSNRLLHLVRRAPWYALAIYPIACAIATAYGRGEYGVAQALASRYTSISGLLWIAAIAIGCTYVARMPALSWRTRGFAAAIAMIVVFAARSEYVGSTAWQAADERSVAARAAFARSDASYLPTMYPDPAREKMLIDELRRIHDGVFAGG